MHSIKISGILLAACLLISCEKEKIDDTKNEQPEPAAAYSQLKIGNYWVYRVYEIDSNGNETATNIYDSAYIENDTIINGARYFKLNRQNFSMYNWNLYLRDSLQYIVDEHGKKIFASEDASELFKFYEKNNADTVYSSTLKMADKNHVLTVPAGTFTTVNARVNFELWPKYVVHKKTMHYNNRYAKNVGLVLETIPYSRFETTIRERRLVRYKVQ